MGNGRFEKGKSGNPSGRLRGVERRLREAWQRAIKAEGSDETPFDEMVRYARAIMKANHDRTGLYALKFLKESGYGQAKQVIALEEDYEETEAVDLRTILGTLDEEGLRAYGKVLEQIERAGVDAEEIPKLLT